MLRRDLLKFIACAPALPASARSWAYAADVAAPAPKYFVLLELNGGNDGLNTLVPYADAEYYRQRPNLGVPRAQVLQLDESLGFNPALEPLMASWKANDLALVQGVGYPEPVRSHFRSIEIWDTGSASDEYLTTGWLARGIRGQFTQRHYTADAVVIGRNPNPLTLDGVNILIIDDLAGFADKGIAVTAMQAKTANPALAHVLAVQSEVRSSAEVLLKKTAAMAPLKAEFPGGPFSHSLQEAAKLIVMGDATPVIKVALGGFDSHSGQRAMQERALTSLAEGLTAFRQSLIAAGLWDQVLVMSYSEFGRRVAENGSAGTDHGAANVHFFMGGKVRGGLYGPKPSLIDLSDGDLPYRQDFRSLYNTVLSGWWGLPQTPFDLKRYPVIPCLKSA